MTNAYRIHWVSLDPGDNVLDTYLRYVIAAVRLACDNEALCAGTHLLLQAAQGWLERHNRVIVMVISFIFGLWFSYKGITGLIG